MLSSENSIYREMLETLGKFVNQLPKFFTSNFNIVDMDELDNYNLRGIGVPLYSDVGFVIRLNIRCITSEAISTYVDEYFYLHEADDVIASLIPIIKEISFFREKEDAVYNSTQNKLRQNLIVDSVSPIRPRPRYNTSD